METLSRITSILEKAKRITIICHRRPDGDTLGSAIGLYAMLLPLKKELTLACLDVPSRRFSFLPSIEKFQKHFLYVVQDLIITLDCGDSKMTGYHEIHAGFLKNDVPILNIDHHRSNDSFGKYNYVDPMASSTTVLVYRILEHMGLLLTEEIALALLTGIYNDTGAFLHSNTNIEAFRIASFLREHGADPAYISRYLFREKPISQLKVWGLALTRMKKNEENVLSSVLTLHDIQACGATSDELGGVIDLMNTVSDAKFALIVAEDEKGFVKGSLRTQHEDVDVADIASIFGGGGHRKAAGFRVKGSLRQERVWKIIETR